MHDLDALAGLIRPATRLLYLNQPHNPTGTLMARPVFEHVIGLARAHGLVVFSDEVYRELEHDPASRLPGACDEYERAVSLGSISKSYGLPGLRTGWVATRDAGLRDAVAALKDYTTICASARGVPVGWVGRGSAVGGLVRGGVGADTAITSRCACDERMLREEAPPVVTLWGWQWTRGELLRPAGRTP
jgi:hypothetical protein